MADQFDSNTRSPHPDAEIDDPLAELARIIGYERPSEVATRTEEAPESSEFDLEAELMRELDVPFAPSSDELDRIEADEELDGLLADAEFDLEPEQDLAEADRAEPDLAEAPDTDDGSASFDVADFGSDEGRSSDALLRAIENEVAYEPEADDGAGAAGGYGEDLSSGPEADEFLSDLDPEEPALASADEADEQEFAEPVADDALLAPVSDLGAEPDAEPSGDEVLADISRFELPQEMPDRQSAFATSAADDDGAVDIDSEYNAEMDYANSDELPATAAVGGGPDEAPLDFEDYLSTELDVYGQEVAMREGHAEPDPAETADEALGDPDFSVETALDTLNDSSLDDEVSVFDDAAEELLAAINDADDFSGAAPASAAPVTETVNEWSLDSIEEAASDELDDELDDMFALPERVVDPVVASSDVNDDLELDLEQVLADSFIDSDDDWAEPIDMMELDAGAQETGADPGEAVESGEWQFAEPAAEPPVERDEMTEAFLGLVPPGRDDAPETAAAASFTGEDRRKSQTPDQNEDQGDWLEGFETSASGSKPEMDGFFFDAELISDADETVEMVGEIDVPELVSDEPQAFEPDYDTEIEREFADIVDRNEPGSDDGFNDAAATGFGVSEGWSRGATTSRGYEVSDEYIALERELGSGADPSIAPDPMAAHAAGHGPAGAFDEPDNTLRGEGDTDNRSRGPVLAIAVLGVALLAGAGAFGWSMLSGDDTSADGGPRIIRADNEPVKVLPENPGGVTVPNQDKAVYDRVAGGAGSSAGQPALVNSAEEPVDVVQRTLDPEILPLEGRADFAEKSEDRLSADGSDAEPGVNGTAPIVSARKVRTMIVKPDGSIVAREVPEPEPAVVAEAQQVPAPVSSPTEIAAETPAGAQEGAQQAAEAAVPASDQVAAADSALTEGTLAPVRVVKTQPIRPVTNVPVPQGRPAEQPVDVIGTVNQEGRIAAAPASPAPSTPAPAPVVETAAPAAAAPAAVAANPGGYYVQIASQPTEEGAQASWRTLSSRYSSVLGGLGVDIQRADIPGKGIFHRVRVPAGSKEQANALCSRYKAAGGSCFVSR